MLASTGHEVTRASDTASGMYWLKAGDFDLVILQAAPENLNWPACATIRHISPSPFIIVSPGAAADDCVKAVEAGADFFMRKPFGPMELIARVNSLLNRAPRRQAHPAADLRPVQFVS